MRILIITFLLLTVAASGCRNENAGGRGGGTQSSSAAMRKVTIRVGQVPLEVEVADTEAQRQMGYMYRDPPTDGGILFVFPAEDYRSFWMKNVSFDLDIAFINSSKRIEQIERMHAWRQSTVSSRRPAMYALEVRAGWFAEQGIEPGTQVEIPAEVTARQ